MVDFGIRDNSPVGMKRAFELGEEAAQLVTEHFQQRSEAIILENEKVCWPFMIWETKKRYCSRYFEKPTDKGKIDIKGLELTRRDNAPLLKRLFQNMIDIIMPLEGNALDLSDLQAEAEETLHAVLREVVDDKIPLDEYIITKSLRKDYKNTNLPHVHLAQQLTHRILKEGLMGYDIPKSGDRMPYVIVQRPGKKLYECAEHPKYVQTHPKIRIDRVYYVKQQLEKPICNLTSYFLPHAKQLFERYSEELKGIQSGNQTLTKIFGTKPKPVSQTMTTIKKRKAKQKTFGKAIKKVVKRTKPKPKRQGTLAMAFKK